MFYSEKQYKELEEKYKKELQKLIEGIKFLEEVNPNHRYLQKAKNQINAINLLRTKYGITDKIFVYFD